MEVLREVLGTSTNVFPLRRVGLDRLEGLDSASVDLIYSNLPAPRDDAHVELRRQEFAVASTLQPVRAVLRPYDTFFTVLCVLEPVRATRGPLHEAGHGGRRYGANALHGEFRGSEDRRGLAGLAAGSIP